MFLVTSRDQTLEEALLNLELDAKAYGWDRMTVRAVASELRLRAAR
jgi:hypothetical protein